MLAHSPAARRAGRKRKPVPVSLGEMPTDLRYNRAADAGTHFAIEDINTPSGQRTGERRRLISPLEQLWAAGVLDSGMYGAARRYQHDADLAAVVGPGATVRYEPRMIDGGAPRFLLPIEAAADYLMRMAAAQRACGPKRRHMLDWIAVEPCGWRQQARAWFPEASETWARSSFQRLLRASCAILEAHYRRRP